MAGPEPITNVDVRQGTRIKNLYTVRKKVGEGSCGAVYLVECLQKPLLAAMKVEPLMKDKDDEILKMEIYVLKRLQGSKHACRLFGCGKTEQFTYMVMSLLGRTLTDLRRRQPQKTFSLGTCLLVGMQALESLEDLHRQGFIHRDAKPTNWAIGAEDNTIIYLFDFGLARQLFTGGKLRKPRMKVSFRGTVRYCSLNIHQHKEPGRHDDLFGLLYSLIELRTSTLPWKGQTRTDSARIKGTVPDATLLRGCPPSFRSMLCDLRKLNYETTPNYDQIRDYLAKDMKSNSISLTHRFEWEKEPKEYDRQITKKERDERAEKDVMQGTDTNRDAKETEPSLDSNQQSDGAGYATNNTLRNLPEVPNARY